MKKEKHLKMKLMTIRKRNFNLYTLSACWSMNVVHRILIGLQFETEAKKYYGKRSIMERDSIHAIWSIE